MGNTLVHFTFRYRLGWMIGLQVWIFLLRKVLFGLGFGVGEPLGRIVEIGSLHGAFIHPADGVVSEPKFPDAIGDTFQPDRLMAQGLGDEDPLAAPADAATRSYSAYEQIAVVFRCPQPVRVVPARGL